MTIPVEMPALIHGAGATPDQGACIMQAVAWLASDGKQWNDAPDCVHPVLRKVAIWVNDSVGTVPRRRLWPLVPRLMGTATGDRKTDVRTGVQLAVWAASRVLPLIKDAERNKTAAARIARARKWLDEPETADADAAAAAAAAAADAAAYAAAYAAYAAAYAAAKIRFLTDLIDEYDRITGRTEPPAIAPEQWESLRRALLGAAA
jgi:hypothetical protein